VPGKAVTGRIAGKTITVGAPTHVAAGNALTPGVQRESQSWRMTAKRSCSSPRATLQWV
jgi:hypothetical protein